MTGSIRRHSDAIKQLLKQFPCVVILGARQVGKTTLIKELLPKAPFFDLEKASDFSMIDGDPEFFLKQYKETLIIDEAQLSPRLFKALRVRIDEDRKKNGRFLISGSSSPDLLSEISESLAGRVGIYELGPLLISEIQERKIGSFFTCLAQQKYEQLAKLSPHQELDIIDCCLVGGYPEPFLLKKTLERKLWFENYIKTYIERDVRRLFPDLQIETYRRFIQMLALNPAQVINQSLLASSLGVSAPTIAKYLDIAQGTYLYRKWPAFSSGDQSKKFVKHSKGALRDTGLICHFLRIQNKADFLGHLQAGPIFETWVVETIIRSFQALQILFDFSFVRTKNQAEIDLVLEGEMGLIPIEIKFGTSVRRENLIFLKEFIKEKKCPLAIVINNSERVEFLADKILQIPASCL